MTKAPPPIDPRERLLRARGQIEQVLREHDLIAHVALCANGGKCELWLHLEAPWCRAFLQEVDGGFALRLRSKLADYKGDRDAQRRDLEDTLGALGALGQSTGVAGMVLLEASMRFDEHTGATHTPLQPEHKQ